MNFHSMVFSRHRINPKFLSVQGQLELDPQGYIVLKNTQETSVQGVYAIGDIVDPHL